MGEFSTAGKSFEGFQNDLFKDPKGQELNDSKDSDEGFSSSFSPTSESSIMQEQNLATSSYLWGSSADKDEFYFTTQQVVSGNPMNTFQGNSRRAIHAPSPLDQARKPTTALSNYLASTKAMASSLGWKQPSQVQSQQSQVSSWTSSFTQPSPIGTTAMSGTWNGTLSNGIRNLPTSMVQINNNNITMQNQSQIKALPQKSAIPTLSSYNSQSQTFYQQQQQAVLASVQASIKNRNIFNASAVSTTNANSMPHNSGFENMDEISHLANSFSNLSAGNDIHSGVTQTNGFFSNPDRRSEDGVKYSSLESRFLGDVFKSALDHDNLATYDVFRGTIQSKKGFPRAREDQIVPNLSGSLNGSPRTDLDFAIERFSRKVFVGGLPPDIDEDEIHASFCRFGPLTVDWPHKAESKSYFPPKGYAFLLYKDEISVQRLIDCCIMQDGKLYLCVSSPTIKDKPVQIRPWNLADADFVMDGSQPLDPRKTIFVGGVPRPLRAVELAMIMDRLYGGVCYAGIDVDPELKYPKGAGRVAFSNQQSYIAAISARFIQLQHGEIDKRVEVKPYVLDDQMCDECHGVRCNGKFAPFFCSNITCLQYYCEQCWTIIHSRPGREFHKPLVKEGGDRPRQGSLGLRWPLKTHPIINLPSIPLLQ